VNHITEMFHKCAKMALPKTSQDLIKHFWLGSIAKRSDGALVGSKNLSVDINVSNPNFEKMRPNQKIKLSHSEYRTLMKSDKGSILYVARISKKDYVENNSIVFKMARPCENCAMMCQIKKVKKVYYTINDSQYGVWDVEKDTDLIFKMRD
jgi:deoxycytidylate deaminase